MWRVLIAVALLHAVLGCYGDDLATSPLPPSASSTDHSTTAPAPPSSAPVLSNEGFARVDDELADIFATAVGAGVDPQQKLKLATAYRQKGFAAPATFFDTALPFSSPSTARSRCEISSTDRQAAVLMKDLGTPDRWADAERRARAIFDGNPESCLLAYTWAEVFLQAALTNDQPPAADDLERAVRILIVGAEDLALEPVGGEGRIWTYEVLANIFAELGDAPAAGRAAERAMQLVSVQPHFESADAEMFNRRMRSFVARLTSYEGKWAVSRR